MSNFSFIVFGMVLFFGSCRAEEIAGELGPSRIVTKPLPDLNVGSAERFGFRSKAPAKTAQMAPSDRPRLFVFDLPSGWEELPGTQFRLINLKVPGDVQCWISTARGSLEANLNRWRGQLGLAPWSPAEIAALPRKSMLALPAVYTELVGDFKGGMGAKPIPAAKMLGLVAELPSGVSVFVKMLGPGEAVDQQIENFDKLRASLAPAKIDRQGDAAVEQSTGTRTSVEVASPGLTWQAPKGWSKTAPRSMRLVSFRSDANPETECWISVFSGEVGGVMANVARWRGQVGLAPLTTDQIAALPRISILGGQAMIIDAAPAGDGGRALLALLSYVEGESTFVKMIGPKSQIEAERDNFMALCRSLRRRGG